jgi:hypothetical protein
MGSTQIEKSMLIVSKTKEGRTKNIKKGKRIERREKLTCFLKKIGGYKFGFFTICCSCNIRIIKN